MSEPSLPRIRWASVAESTSVWTKLAKPFRTASDPLTEAFRASLMSSGVPEVLGANTPREDALGLLKLAAEVEHALLVQYLYAGLSVTDSTREVIDSIAVQEMGHLITLQNLLIAIGGVDADGVPRELCFSRDLLRRGSQLNPLRFVLEPLSHIALAKYICAERPANIEDTQLRARVEALTAEATEDGIVPLRVAAIYAKLLWLFQSTDEPTTPIALSRNMGLKGGWHLSSQDYAPADVIDAHASRISDWGGHPGLICDVVVDSTTACAALLRVMAQGEGPLPSADSHFDQFVHVLDRFEGQGVQTRSLPRTPYLAEDGTPEDPRSTLLTNEYGGLWARLFNIRYSLLMVDLAWLLALPHSDVRRARLSATLRNSMASVMNGVAEHLVSLPRGDDELVPMCPTYHLQAQDAPRSLDSFRERYRMLIEAQRGCVDAIRARPEFQVCDQAGCEVRDFNGEILLDGIEQHDHERSLLMP